MSSQRTSTETRLFQDGSHLVPFSTTQSKSSSTEFITLLVKKGRNDRSILITNADRCLFSIIPIVDDKRKTRNSARGPRDIRPRRGGPACPNLVSSAGGSRGVEGEGKTSLSRGMQTNLGDVRGYGVLFL